MSLAEERTRPAAERVPPVQRELEIGQSDHPATPKAKAPRFRRVIVAAAVLTLVIAAAVGGLVWWLDARNWVSTDDAFIQVHMVQVSPQIAGRVARVLVDDNQEVKTGQPLLEIDQADFKAKLDEAAADQQSAVGKLAQSRAQLAVSEANVDEAAAMIGVAEADANNAAINLARDQKLAQMHSMALSQQQLDNDTATARRTAANLRAAKQKSAAAEAQRELARTQVQTAEAGVKAATAQLEQARLNLSYTEIRAPEGGHIAHKSVAGGDYVQVGQDLMALVPDDVWITANFKETDLADIQIGDPVDINVDAYPSQIFHGRVDSFQAGSGAAFALLPPENATGNYVKVVQRVPVKIVFDHLPGEHWVLGPGMSVVPHVRIR
jgi:membrane fusion protein (multidrug efflux system)